MLNRKEKQHIILIVVEVVVVKSYGTILSYSKTIKVEDTMRPFFLDSGIQFCLITMKLDVDFVF